MADRNSAVGAQAVEARTVNATGAGDGARSDFRWLRSFSRTISAEATRVLRQPALLRPWQSNLVRCSCRQEHDRSVAMAPRTSVACAWRRRISACIRHVLRAAVPASTRRPTPRSRSSSTVLTRCFRPRPGRSSFHTNERLSRLKRLQTRFESRAMSLASRIEVFVDPFLGHAGVDEGVALQVQTLASIGFGNPRIADQHSPAPPVRLDSTVSRNLAKKFATIPRAVTIAPGGARNETMRAIPRSTLRRPDGRYLVTRWRRHFGKPQCDAGTRGARIVGRERCEELHRVNSMEGVSEL